MQTNTYWSRIWNQFSKNRLGLVALYLILLFIIVAIYAPFLASSRPLFVIYDHEAYFPLFRYLFFSGFFTKGLDIFFNLMIFTGPLFLTGLWLWKKNRRVGSTVLLIVLASQFIIFLTISYLPPKDPAADPTLNKLKQELIQKNPGMLPSWDFDLSFMNPYARLNLIVQYRLRERQQEIFQSYAEVYAKHSPSSETTLPTLWQVNRNNEEQELKRQNEIIEQLKKTGSTASPKYLAAQAKLQYILDRRQWLEQQSSLIKWEIMPLLSSFHWEDDAGGQQTLNRYVPWYHLTRINRKDLLAALIFGIRISLVVGICSVGIALLIGIPIGAFAGYYGGKLDIIVSRLLEIWESMPTFFMLLMVVAILQNKSIFFVIGAIGLFGWTTFSRFIRGEFFKQRTLPYVESCQASGFKDAYIMFRHILPNAIPPVLALLPFAIMGAITSEAGLSFLGLGEEGSSSWGVLMDEGRTAFPEESYLLWPPAILLTIFLVAIALVGDSLRDALDPKRQR